MKIKHKRKVYPSPSSSSSSSSSQPQPSLDALSVLKRLPAAILASASVLSTEDKEVLAYLLTRSMTLSTTTTPSPSSLSHDSKKKSKSKKQSSAAAAAAGHRPPLFHCDCFECYTSYWFRWDSSPNRELIHKAIEAFEEQHPNSGEKPTRISSGAGRGKKKNRLTRRLVDKPSEAAPSQPQIPVADQVLVPEVLVIDMAPEDHAPTARDGCEREGDDEELLVEESSQKGGLARRVLPDVLGLLNSRLWSLWSPTM